METENLSCVENSKAAVIPVSKVDYSVFEKLKPCRNPRGNPHRSVNKHYLDCICTFDIESSRIRELEQSVMYIWQFNLNAKLTIIGRTWQEYFDMLLKIKGVIGNYWLCIYVHNLS